MSAYNMLKGGWKQLQKEFKEDITINHITSETVNSYDEATATTTSVSTKGVVYDLNLEYAQERYGDLQMADIMVLLNSDETISERDTITHKSRTYRIFKLDSLDTKGGIIGYVATGKRIS